MTRRGRSCSRLLRRLYFSLEHRSSQRRRHGFQRVATPKPLGAREPFSGTAFMSIAVVVVLIIIGLSGLRIAQEYQRGVVFRLGRYVGLRGPGLYWIIPLNIERIVRVPVAQLDLRSRLDDAAFGGVHASEYTA